MIRCLIASLLLLVPLTTLRAADEKPSADASDWAASVKFPASEKPVRLFNGKNFDGWIRQERLWGAYPNEKVD